ncbi:MAG: hypothetical protein HYY44_01830 [Deltaproteobacteria bacterium]|nr:hypothetical protein [Deltaproteobacteria bacterium]
MTGTSIASDEAKQDQIELTRRGTELLLKRNYPEARKFIYQLLAQEETRLLGYFGIMAATQLRNLENYDYRFDSEYLVLAEEGRKRALKIYRNANSGGWDLLVAGGILGVSGFYQAHHGKWLPALWDSQAAARAMKRAYGRDPHLADALLGIGFYHYWMSHFTRYFKVLPFLDDRRESGKREVRLAGELGRMVGPLAEVSLGFKMRKQPEARREFEKILEIDPSLTKCWLYLGLITAEEGKDPKEARRLLGLYLNLENRAPPHWRKRAEEGLRRLGSTK